MWAVLAWLSILAHTRKPVSEVLHEHWGRYGRSYYQRHDYEGVSASAANEMLAELKAKLGTLVGTALAGSRVSHADDFSYTDPVNGATAANQGLRILLEDGSRIVARLSGTGTEGATLRMYFEAYSKEDIDRDAGEFIQPLANAADRLMGITQRLSRSAPDVIT